MPLVHHDDNDAANTAFRDLIMAAFAMVLMCVAMYMLIPIIENKDAKNAPDPIGNIRVEVFWPNTLDVDIDTWVMAPDERPVGYSNKNGITFDLLRDDLGNMSDLTPLNYEAAISRGLKSGEYVVNLHWYSNRAKADLVPVDVVVSLIMGNGKAAPIEIFKGKRVLTKLGEEPTVTRFTLDKEFKLIPGSLNTIPLPLRSNTKLG